MIEFTDQIIEKLISCPKRIVRSPYRNMKEDRGHMKNDFEAESEDGKHRFFVFIRYNKMFSENFSIGLNYNPRDNKGSVLLFRCNGAHGGTRQWDHHDQPHIHLAKAETLNRGLNAETKIESTSHYASWQGALQFFLKRTHVKGAEKYFPPPQSQGNLFDDGA